MVWQTVMTCGIAVSAATVLTITSPEDGEWVSYLDAPDLEWEAVDGVAGYRVSIRNLTTNELLVENKWTTKTYFSLDGHLDAAQTEYKIWVGAMSSKSADAGEAFPWSVITIHTEPETPTIEDEDWVDKTYNSVVLCMNITKDNGSAITDSGFHIVESGLPTSEWETYSFKKYGSYSATTKGYKEMTITGLKPYTTYYFYAYAINGEGETVTSESRFTTDKYECPHESGVYTNTYPESISYIDTDSATQHKEIWYYNECCNKCNAVVNAEAVTETYYRDHTWVNDVCKYCRYAKEETDTFALSQTSISWGYGAGNEADVTVTYSGSYSYEIEYDVPSSVKNSEYDYEWLTVSKSGSTLNIRPKRINYAATARSATITVTSGGQSKDITVTQAKCGESAPTIQLWRGDSTNKTVYSDGDTIGSYSLPQDNMDVSLTVSNVQKVTGYLSYKGGSRISTSTSTSMLRFDISDLLEGDYQIDVYASNSATANDYWSQNPFADGSMTLYFSLYNESSSGGESGDYTVTADDIIKNAEAVLGRQASYFGWSEDWCAYFVGKIGRDTGANFPQKDSDSATGRHLAAWFVNNEAGKFYYLRQKNYESLVNSSGAHATEQGKKLCYDYTDKEFTPQKGDIIIFLWSTADAGINWSHVGFVKNYDSSSKTIYTIEGNTGSPSRVCEKTRAYDSQVVGFIRPNYANTITYDCNDWEDGSVTITTVTKKYNEDLTITDVQTTNGDKVFLGWAVYPDLNTPVYQPGDRFTENRTECFYAVWGDPETDSGDDENTSTCEHVWGDWEGEGSTQVRYCTLCEAFQTRKVPGAEIVVYTLSGTITSYGDADEPVQLQLLDTSLNVVRSTTTTEGTYRVIVKTNTTYTLVISKANHVSQSYRIIIGDTSAEQDATLWLYGDLNKDGVVNNKDVTLFQEYFAGYTRKIPNDLADLDEDGMVTRRDAMILARHVKGWKGYDTLPYTD